MNATMVDLRWLGLDWDEGPDVGGPSEPYVQSQRLSIYQEALDSLIAKECVYPCTCTRAELAHIASAPHSGDGIPTYPGTCSSRRAGDGKRLSDRPYVWRIRVPSEPISWDDLFVGRVEIDQSQGGGDFVVARHGIGYSYQFAVVIDDILMGVTQVVRGCDILPSTPQQIVLYKQLGYPRSAYGHVALVYGADGRRLAKRVGSIQLSQLRAFDVDPQRLIGSLVHSCGWSDVPEPMTPLDAIKLFEPANHTLKAWTVTEEWLAWLQDE